MRNLACLLLAASLCASAQAQDTSVTERVAQQNALFEEFYEAGLKSSPERATSVGDYRYNDQLGDASLAQIERKHAEDNAFLRRLRAIPTAGMAETDRVSHDLLERQIVRGNVSYELKNYEMSLNQQNGVHTSLADLPLSVPLDSVKHYEDYIARLHQIPRVLQQTVEVLRAGMKDGLMPPKLVVDQLPGQCEGIVSANPFVLPLKKFPATFSEEEKQRLTAATTKTANEEVLPAFNKLAAFLRDEYAPKGRTAISVESLPDGQRRYAESVKTMTTLEITPDAVHEVGLKEVARITAEMTQLAKVQGYKDLAAFRNAIHGDPKWQPKNEDQIVADFKKHIDEMQPLLPELFGLLPKSPVTVEAIPDFDKAAATHYVRGTPDGKRAGRVVVAVADPTHRTLVNDEAVAYHEGVPGHHMQISVAQQLEGLPKFRVLGGGLSAYTEGWALYSEELGKEVGLYKDPVSDYGRLNSELFRAVRLVVDTGIHHKGWTRDQVITYMHENDVNDVQAQTETNRYIAWPGQALAYKMGQLKIRELRERAKAQLGPRFDIKAFHDEILNGGPLPLDLLDERVNGWIKSQGQPQAEVK
ncbi:MAG TPA: DUF885 domain-containing protein [Thermoanaerobaculia bacterium]|jgi:uncharacterized protein (DUF885 family)|nr:DUF885 domain-containing protein [Thermoanaerobaculia bacterium]